MWIDPHLDLITVFLLQHSGNGEEINKCRTAAADAARKRFGKTPAKR
jgi:hypothetical protein